jgi:GH35 family endo-1,4-beta-xylanase
MKTTMLIFLCFLLASCTQTKSTFPKSEKEDVEGIMGKEYWSQWNSGLQDRIDKDIDKNRKADAVLYLSDAMPGSEVTIEQLTHDFRFGAHIFNFDQLGSNDLNEKYKDLFGTLFNSATLAFYWNAFEPEPGKPRYKTEEIDSESYWNKLSEPWTEFHWRRPSPEKIIEFCEAKNICMHGHPLLWRDNRNHPEWISKDADKVDEMERLFEKRIREIARYYGDRIPSWDVVNESVDPAPDKPRHDVVPEDYTYKSFKVAEEEFPASVLLNINDSWRAVYPPFIKDLIDRGAKIDILGLQMHIFYLNEAVEVAQGKEVYPNGTSWKPQDVIGYLEELDRLERPIHLSEITIPAPGKDSLSNKIQAVLLQNMYRLWFSHPRVYKITWWNVVDDCGASGEPTTSGLFTRQMEAKPAFYAMDNLINNEWKTNLKRKAKKNGEVKFRGFKGNYRVTWKDKSGKEKTAEFYLQNNGDGF